MAVNDLTRQEAKKRASLLRVASYAVWLDLTAGDTTFHSTTVVRFVCRRPGASTFIELTAPRVHSIALNGESLNPEDVFDGNRIRLDGLRESNVLEVAADCAYSRSGEGLHRFVDPVDGGVYLYSQFETYDAHRVYACFDQPDLKAVFTLHVNAPSEWAVVSNSRPAGTEAAGEHARSWRFRPTPVLSTYVTAIVAGPYHSVRDVHDDIELGVFCRRSLAEFLDAEEILAVTRQGFDFFHRAFDYRYAFDKYDQLFVRSSTRGDGKRRVRDVPRGLRVPLEGDRRAPGAPCGDDPARDGPYVVRDLVTMQWWDDLWLNESFATYASVLAQVAATRWKNGWTTSRTPRRPGPTGRISCPPPIRSWPTPPTWKPSRPTSTGSPTRKALPYSSSSSRGWVRRSFSPGCAPTSGARVRQHDAARPPRGAGGGQWPQPGGLVEGVAGDDRGQHPPPPLRGRLERLYTLFDVVQEATDDHPTLRSHRIAVGLYDRGADGMLWRRERVELDVTGRLTEVAKLLRARQPDLLLLNDDDLTFAKIRLDPRSLETVTTSIGAIREPLPRASCWAAAWDMTRDAEMRARDYLRLVLGGVRAEPEIGVVQSLLQKAYLAVNAYGDLADAPAGGARPHRHLAAAAARTPTP